MTADHPPGTASGSPGGVPDAPAAGADLPGSPGVARALELLEALPGIPVAGHVEVFDEVHRLLQDALATVDGA